MTPNNKHRGSLQVNGTEPVLSSLDLDSGCPWDPITNVSEIQRAKIHNRAKRLERKQGSE